MNKKPLMQDENNNNLYITIGRYASEGNIYLGLVTDDDSYCDITINLPNAYKPSKESVYLSADLPNKVFDELEKKSIISDVLWEEQYNMGKYKLVQFFPENLKEYLFKEQIDEYFSEEDYELS